MKVKLCGKLQEMASEEVLRNVSALDYRRIIKADPKACFKAFCIGHEGESSGKVIGIGKVVKRWARAAIEKMTNVLEVGTKVFHLHEMTNDHEGRKPIGEIVGKAISDVAGKLSSIAIMYIYPEYKDVPLDVASIEADITVPETINPNARSVEVDVDEITGVALGNSQVVSPGFAGATLLATMQEFAANADHEKPPKEGEKPMTKAELIAAIREAKLTLSDLFSPREIADDSSVQDVIREKRRNEDGFEGRQSAKLEAQVKKLEDDNKALQARLDVSAKGTLKIRAAEAIKPAIEKRKLDEKQSAFILKNAAKFDPKSEDTLAGDLDKFLDGQLDELKAFHELYGIKPGESGKANVGAGKASDTSVEDLLTPDALKDEVKK